MKVYDYKKTSPLLWCLVLCMSFFSLTLSAQGDDLACASQVNISVGADCDIDLSPELFTENTAQGPMPVAVRFSFQDPNDAPYDLDGGEVPEGDFECGMYTFTVYDNSNNKCWGTVKIEDKLPPVPPAHPCDRNTEDSDSDTFFNFDDPLIVDADSDGYCDATCFDVDARLRAFIRSSNYFDIDGPIASNSKGEEIKAGSSWNECGDDIIFLGQFKPSLDTLGWFTKVTITPEDDCMDSTIVHYIINFKDDKGNKGADTISFEAETLGPQSIVQVPAPYKGSCDDSDLSPNVTGLPTLPGAPTGVVLNFVETTENGKNGGNAQLCNLIISYWDIKTLPACYEEDDEQLGNQNLTACGNSRKILREWTIIDWCTGQIVPTFSPNNQNPFAQDIQILELKDTIDPVVVDKTYEFSTDPWKCAGEFTVTITAIDTCSGPEALIYTLTGPAGVSISNSGERGDSTFHIKHAPPGTHVFNAYAEDCCGNVGEGTITITITDDVKPFAIAKEFTVTSVIQDPTNPGDAIAKVYWNSIDNGSWDACSDLEYFVRRMDGDVKRDEAGNILRRSDKNAIHCDDKDYFPLFNVHFDDKSGGLPSLGSAIASYADEVEMRTKDASGNGIIQYNGDEWGELVKFCCTDFGTGEDADGDGQADEYRVELIVFDKAGNWNITWGWVKIEDPTPPTPMIDDYYAFCHDEVLNGPIDEAVDRIVADAGKLVKFVGVCGNEYEPFDSTVSGLWYDETCKYGGFTITWSVRGGKGSVVRAPQTVYIEYKDDFSCHDILGWSYNATGNNRDKRWYNSNGTVIGDRYDYRDQLDVECTPPTPEDLTWDAGPCELIGWTMKSDTFQFETDACVKILNEWTVIDWCVYDANGKSSHELYSYWREYKNRGSSIDNDDDYCEWIYNKSSDTYSEEPGYRTPHWYTGVYKWKQLIKVSEDDAPVISGIEDGMKVDTFLGADCGTGLELTLTAEDTGDEDCRADWFKWELFRVIKDSQGRETSVTSRGIRTGVSATWTSASGAIAGNDNNPKEERCYRVKVWDGCGNVDILDFVWKIVDGKPPTPYCINLSTALMVDPDGDGPMNEMVELWACDFDQGSFDNCTNQALLFHTFDGVAPATAWLGGSVKNWAYNFDQYYRDGELLYHKRGNTWYVGASLTNNVSGSTETAAFNAVVLAYNTGDHTDGEIYYWDTDSPVCGRYTAGKVFTQDELDNGDTDGDGNVDVRVDVWDSCFNMDWCSVQLTLRCTTCGDGGPVANVEGTIATEAGSDVAGVEVTLDNLTNPEYKLTKITGNDGAYAFASNPMYNGYDISAIKSGDDDEGVSTLDLVMIQRHILGLAPFTSPYKVIASDINSNGDVSATDLIVLRKLILGIYKEFPQNESWRFVDAGQSLTVENALENFSEVLNIAELDANMTNEDFIAVKIGDVNGDAKTNARRTATQIRNANKVAMTIEDRNVKAGEVVNITFGSDEFSQVYGYQFTIELNGLQFEAVKAGAANMTDDNVALLDANTLTVSYADINGLNASDNIFTIAAVASKDGAISEMININSSKLNSEAYVGTSLDVATVELNLAGKEVAGFELGQNEPNPFNDFTVVGFTLPEAGEAQITVFDVAGKVITSRFGEYAKGYNVERFTKGELGVSGVLYYTLESGDHTATKKMIIIE